MQSDKDRPQTRESVSGGRIIGFDLARAVAVFGMILVNYRIVMAMPAMEPAWLAWIMESMEGRAAALFVVLAGVGMSLMTARARRTGDGAALCRQRLHLFRRAFWLFLFGLAFLPFWEADILHFYGVYIAVGTLLIAVRGGVLLSAGVVSILGFCLLYLEFDYGAGWDWKALSYQGYWTVDGMVRHLFFNGFHPVFPWLALLLLGIWLGRQDLRQPQTQKRILLAACGMVVFSHALSNRLSAWLAALSPPADPVIYLTAMGAIPPSPFYLFSTGGTALLVITACVRISRHMDPGHGLVRAITATGRQSLTLYIGHILVGMPCFAALGLLENRSLPFSLAAGFLVCLLSVVFSTAWERYIGRGFLETLLRRLAG